MTLAFEREIIMVRTASNHYLLHRTLSLARISTSVPLGTLLAIMFVSSALSGDKYSVEMNTTSKSDHLCSARGATGNKIHMAQNIQFFRFPIYGLQSRIDDTNTNSLCADILVFA